MKWQTRKSAGWTTPNDYRFFGSSAREEVRRQLQEFWQPLHKELFTNIQNGNAKKISEHCTEDSNDKIPFDLNHIVDQVPDVFGS